MSNEVEIDLNLELGRIIERIETLNLTFDTLKYEYVPISMSFVVLEQRFVTNQNLRTRIKGYNMDFRVRGGHGCRK